MTAQDAVVVESTGGASTRSRQALVVTGVGLVCLNLLTQTPRTGFGGSPTILVDGIDLFPTTLVHSLACRVYVTENGFAGAPTATQIGEALRDRMQGGESDR